MLPITRLECTNGVLDELPRGKPDPKQEAAAADEVRRRVLRKADQTNTCWYTTLSMIRRRIGPLHETGLGEARRVEAICSKRRKGVQKCEANLPRAADELGNPAVAQILRTYTKAKVQPMNSKG